MLEPVAEVFPAEGGGIVVAVSKPLTGELRQIFFADDEAVAVYRALHTYIQGGS
jgi:hypothetical protein